MRLNHIVTVIALAAFLSFGVMARADTAAGSFAKGEGLLAKGDLHAALAAYADAARADRANREYVQHYTMLRRVIQLREQLDEEKEPARWENTARALHAFFVGERVYSEALALGQKIHARLNNAWSAITLAETQLALDLNDEAAKTLADLEPERASAATQALLGIALVRGGQTDRAKAIADSIVLPQQAKPQTVYAVARLSAAVGDSTKASELLARCLQSVPPSRQDGFKEHANTSPEFASMAGDPEFAKAMKTPSKVPESKCSGGKSCAGCPMRGNCPGSQGK